MFYKLETAGKFNDLAVNLSWSLKLIGSLSQEFDVCFITRQIALHKQPVPLTRYLDRVQGKLYAHTCVLT